MRAIVALAHEHGIPLASHDDTTEENVADAVSDRVSVAEFPTTMEAAHGLHKAGIGILMGAPNVVRGGSHSATSPRSISPAKACWASFRRTTFPQAF